MLGLRALSGEKRKFLLEGYPFKKDIQRLNRCIMWLDMDTGLPIEDEKKSAIIREYEMAKVGSEEVQAIETQNVSSFFSLIDLEDVEFLE